MHLKSFNFILNIVASFMSPDLSNCLTYGGFNFCIQLSIYIFNYIIYWWTAWYQRPPRDQPPISNMY